jgi:hypothetical protein
MTNGSKVSPGGTVGRIHTLFLVRTARCAVRATFSGAASGQKAFAGGGMRSAHGGAGGDIAARCPYHFKNSAWMRPEPCGRISKFAHFADGSY